MKYYNYLKSYHPIVAMLVFDVVVSLFAFVIGFPIHQQTGMTLSTVFFLEALLFLVIAQSSVMGNSKLKIQSYTIYREFKPDDSHNAAYFVALKYGMVGVFLMGMSWAICLV